MPHESKGIRPKPESLRLTHARAKNAREVFRLHTDAEEFARKIEKALTPLRAALRQIADAYEEEVAESPIPEGENYMEEALRVLGQVKGQMYLQRFLAGLTAEEVAVGAQWSQHTLSQFENRDADGLVSSLFRYAAGLRRAGVAGRIEIRWVSGEPAELSAPEQEAA